MLAWIFMSRMRDRRLFVLLMQIFVSTESNIGWPIVAALIWTTLTASYCRRRELFAAGISKRLCTITLTTHWHRGWCQPLFPCCTSLICVLLSQQKRTGNGQCLLYKKTALSVQDHQWSSGETQTPTSYRCRHTMTLLRTMQKFLIYRNHRSEQGNFPQTSCHGKIHFSLARDDMYGYIYGTGCRRKEDYKETWSALLQIQNKVLPTASSNLESSW